MKGSMPSRRRSNAVGIAFPAAVGIGLGSLGVAAGCSTILGIEDVPPAMPDGGDGPAAESNPDAASDAQGDGSCSASEVPCNGVCVPQNDPRNCGRCGHDCTNLPSVSGAFSCVAGACAFDAGACAPGFAHCAGSADLGCETPVNTPQNCGACSATCGGATPYCALVGEAGAAYACSSNCLAGQKRCGGSCTDTNTDPTNCMTCGHQCTTSVSRASAQCAAGSCTFECDLGYTSCGGGCVDVTSDPANCGRCGHACQGGACTGAPPMCQPVTLATGPVYIQGLTVSSTTVYWTDTMSGAVQPAGTVMALPIGGGTPVTFVSGQDHPGAIVADNTNVYWTGDSSGLVQSKVLGMGGGITTIASGQSIPANLTVDATNVYWTDYLAPDGGAGGSVMKAPIGGGVAPVVLATGQISPWSLGVSATDVYWVNYGGTIVMRVPIAGGSPVTVVQGEQPDGASVGAGGLVVGPANVYWTEAGATTSGGTVMSVPLAGGAPATLATAQDGVGEVTLDGTNLYWTNYNGGQVMTMPLAGGVAPTTLATGQAGPGNIVADATTVYWANYAGGQVMKVAKP